MVSGSARSGMLLLFGWSISFGVQVLPAAAAPVKQPTPRPVPRPHPLPAEVAATAAAETALLRGLACYDGLDYQCAGEQVLQALRGPLPVDRQVLALRIEAQVALAYQDQPRARKAARALLALQPDFNPGPEAPQLRELLELERAADRPAARLDWSGSAGIGALLLVGQDAEQWEDALAGEFSCGYQGWPDWTLAVHGRYSSHAALSFRFESLGLLTMGLQAERRILGDSPRLEAGFELGVARVAPRGLTGEIAYWGGQGGLTLQVRLELGWHLWLYARTSPTLLGVMDGEQVAFSYLFPFSLGLRYP